MSVSITYPVAQLKVFIQYGIAPIVFDSVKYFKGLDSFTFIKTKKEFFLISYWQMKLIDV